MPATRQARTAAAAGIGFLGVNATAAVGSVDPLINASVGPNSLVNVTGNVDINADSVGSTSAQPLGFALSGTGLALGASVALATLTPSVTADIGNGSTVVSTLGNVTVQAPHNYNPSTSPPTPYGLPIRSMPRPSVDPVGSQRHSPGRSPS